MDILRFGVSMERELVEKLDTRAAADGYANRSAALRALVRKELAHQVPSDDLREVAGIVTLLYPYGRRMSECPIASFPTLTIAANLQLHVHGNICLKLIVVQGSAADVHGWARTVTTQRGVLGELKVVATEDVYSVLGDELNPPLPTTADATEHASAGASRRRRFDYGAAADQSAGSPRTKPGNPRAADHTVTEQDEDEG